MPYLDKHDKIREQFASFRHEAPENSWNRISSKLNADKLSSKKKKLRFIRFFSTIAASSALVIAFFSIVYHESSHVQIIQKAQVQNWEELSNKEDYFYSVQNARRANHLFQSIGDKGSLERTSGLPDIFRNDAL